jgi:Icc-related predicted phosphoesterase
VKLALLAAVATVAGCRSGATLRLGAVADAHGAAAATLANLERVSGVFSNEHVQGVLALGDLGETEDEIAAVLRKLGGAHAPVYALPGELEPEGAFHAAVARVHAEGVDVVDLVDNRAIRVRDVSIVAIPGYRYSSHGFRYAAGDLERVRKTRGRLVLASHTPPKGHGEAASDWAIGDVNAGDPAITELVDTLHPVATLFAHVDEAGGRADNHGVNVGSVANGMAALVDIGDGGLRARVLR